MDLSSDELESAYRRLEKPLHNYLYRWFWHPAVSEDLIHDAFERIWQRRGKVDAARVDALVWTTLINLARSRYRRGQRWQWVPLPPSLWSGDNPESVTLADERDRRLRKAIGGLANTSREALLLEMYSGLSRAEIASLLGIPEGTLASRKHNAVRQLNGLLKEVDHAD